MVSISAAAASRPAARLVPQSPLNAQTAAFSIAPAKRNGELVIFAKPAHGACTPGFTPVQYDGQRIVFGHAFS
jgi:hypothetical protein